MKLDEKIFHVEFCCDYCGEPIHTHWDCPYCGKADTPTSIYGESIWGREIGYEFDCEACKTESRIVAITPWKSIAIEKIS